MNFVRLLAEKASVLLRQARGPSPPPAGPPGRIGMEKEHFFSSLLTVVGSPQSGLEGWGLHRVKGSPGSRESACETPFGSVKQFSHHHHRFFLPRKVQDMTGSYSQSWANRTEVLL